MIRFECRCRHVFEVPPEMAGDAIQCPQCGLLNDVPVLSQLSGLDEHGNYKVGQDTTLKEPDRLEQLNRAFAKTRVDEHGEELDLRTTIEELKNVGGDDAYDLVGDPRSVAPKYDPITGELIREIEIDEEHLSNEPVAALGTPALEYAANRHADAGMTPARALPQLFAPENIVVIFFCYIIATFGNLVFVGPLSLFSHFANIIDETGWQENDEMPRSVPSFQLARRPLGSVRAFLFSH